MSDDLAVTGLDGPKLEPACGDRRAKRPCSGPGEADPRGNDDQEAKEQSNAPARAGWTVSGFGDGHYAVVG